MVEQVLVSGDDRVSFAGLSQREQIIVARVAQHRLGIDRIVTHHRHTPERRNGLFRLGLIEQGAKVRLGQGLVNLRDQGGAHDHLDSVVVNRFEQDRGRRIGLADQR